MATRTFLTDKELREAQEKLKTNDGLEISLWLGERLEARLSAHPLWRESKPYRLGSWSRGELCAKSDIDLLFVGNEEVVKKLVSDFQSEGIKIRYRVPADLEDWTQGVQAFDVLALIWAQPFFASDGQQLHDQQGKIQERGLKYKKELFRHMMRERKERTRRYDSISNYLEPNLKYGPGGLRDLEQGLMIRHLFVDNFQADVEAEKQLKSYKKYFIKIRHYLHLHGAGDILVASLQKEMAHLFGYPDVQKWMSRVQKDLSEVSFYADWMAEAAKTPKHKREKVQSTKVNNFEDAMGALHKDSSIIMQQHIRQQKIQFKERKKIGRVLERYLRADMKDDYLQALFRSQILPKVIPQLARLRGHVQHDQYHRYSVDAHTLQAMRGVLRIKKHPKRLGRLTKLARQMRSEEWDVLLWTALYHDLGKGLKGSHAQEGAQIAKRDLVAMGVSLKLTAQVVWMVQNHLLLSGAAFRQNPQAPSTWTELFRRGVKGRRISKLAVFTVIDILATNPEAWNEWKERLLADLAQALLSPKASQLNQLLELAEKKKIKVAQSFVENLDPQIMESVPNIKLLRDYEMLKKTKFSSPPLVMRNRQGETWIRFHSRQDRPGLFLSYVKQMHGLGLSVQEAFVQTYTDLGVYDWFKVKTSRPIKAVSAWLKKPTLGKSELPKVQFAVVEIISQDESSVILSFRGRDQRGALLSAAQTLYDSGFEILSAKVHTWGRQIDDIFTVKKGPDFNEQLRSILTPSVYNSAMGQNQTQ